VPRSRPTRPPAGWVGCARTSGRFSTGDAHGRRRGYAATVLASIDPETLRRRAGALTAVGQDPAHIPVAALAEALGVPPEHTQSVVDAVATVARGYFPGTDAGAAGEAAVAYLIEVFGGIADEPTAARIGLLVQACNATAALIANTLEGRGDPPVPALRRVCVAAARSAAPT
jgi:hypothetical protein